jgi:hypothetical protein
MARNESPVVFIAYPDVNGVKEKFTPQGVGFFC